MFDILKREQGLPEHVNAPRNVVKHVGKILSIDLRTEGSTPFEVSELIFQGPSSTVSEQKQKERPILHCVHAVLHEDYSWKYYQT